MEDLSRNKRGNRPADRALCTGKCALKTSERIGQGVDPLIGQSIQGNVH